MKNVSLYHACAAPWGYELLHNIDIEIEPGNILAIVGPNGAGKSSLLQVLSGQMPLSEGSLLLADKPLALWQRLEQARAVALLPQQSTLNFPFTVAEVILLGRTPHFSGTATDHRIVDQVMQLTDTLSLGDRLYTRLSGGERQRVQLARVMAQLWRREDSATRLLLLDEPNNALDPAHQQMVLRLIQQLARDGVAVALVMHDFNLVAQVADQIMVLNEGRQVAHGNCNEVFTRQMFAETFKVTVHLQQHPDSGRTMVFPA